MGITARVKQALQAIETTGSEPTFHRCNSCGATLDPAEDADVGYECTTCGAVLGKRPQVCPQCDRYTFERTVIEN